MFPHIRFTHILVLFVFVSMFYSPSSAAEWTLKFRSGRSVVGSRLFKPERTAADSFLVVLNDITVEAFSVDSLVNVRRQKGPYTTTGIVVGVLGGGLVCGLIGAVATPPADKDYIVVYIGIGALSGLLVGGVVGGVIGGNAGSDESIDLTNADVNSKIEILKNFIR